MLPITERAFLQELRETANRMYSDNVTGPLWAGAYMALAAAADKLDAMEGRSTNNPPTAPSSTAAQPAGPPLEIQADLPRCHCVELAAALRATVQALEVVNRILEMQQFPPIRSESVSSLS